MFGVLVIAMSGDLYTRSYLKSHYLRFERAEAAEITTPVIEDDRQLVDLNVAKSKVVDLLQKCESGGRKDEEGIIVWDTNNKPSIGVLQFQPQTVQFYYKKLYGKEITGKEAVLIALDTEKARSLATDIIFTTENGVAKDWVNCTRWHGLDARVQLIKELEQ
jgi:hypothetical protein